MTNNVALSCLWKIYTDQYLYLPQLASLAVQLVTHSAKWYGT